MYIFIYLFIYVCDAFASFVQRANIKRKGKKEEATITVDDDDDDGDSDNNKYNNYYRCGICGFQI